MALELDISKWIKTSNRLSENYKTFRANVEFCGTENRIIAITSSIPGEGKSTTAFHLAYELAKSGKKTLFLDADLRRSMFNLKFEVPREDSAGFSELLARKASITDVLYSCKIPNLYIILSGKVPPNPSELLSSKMFSVIIAALKKEFDYIIVDTPPLVSVIDGAIIAKECDGVIIVIGSDQVSCRVIAKVRQQLELADCKVLGAVLNKIRYSNRTLYGTYGTNKKYYTKYNDYDEE